MFQEVYQLDSGKSKTEIIVGSSLSRIITERLNQAGTRCVFVSSGLVAEASDDVDAICNQISAECVIVSDGEGHKDLDTYGQMLDQLLSLKLTRNDAIAYIGGGTLGDLTGFIASTFKRGISFSAVPTTLLSMIDASIGGKNGVDTPALKNAVGTFHNPSLVMVDSNFLRTDELIQKWGIAELIKVGVALDEGIIQLLNKSDSWKDLLSSSFLEDLIARGIKAKMRVVQADPLEREGKREILNFGHTVGHAIEQATSFTISHGQAVLTGMIIESRIASRLFPESVNLEEKIDEIASLFDLKPFQITDAILPVCTDAMLQDKKRQGEELTIQKFIEEGKARNVRVEIGKFIDVFREVFH